MGTPKNQSVVKAFRLLQSFTGPNEWLTSAELSRRANLPQASGYRIVHTLEEIGAIVRDSRGRYRPGMLLVDLSQEVSAGEIWSEVSNGVLRDLATSLGVTAHVGILENGMVTYMAKAGSGAAGIRTRVGAQMEAYCTALGKVLLAALPDEALNSFLDEGELIPLTERTVTDRGAFLHAARRVRSEGLAFDDRETLDNLCCLAAPIYNPAGRIVAAVSISDDPGGMTEQRRPALNESMRCAARAIGGRIYRGGGDAGAFRAPRTASAPLARASLAPQ